MHVGNSKNQNFQLIRNYGKKTKKPKSFCDSSNWTKEIRKPSKCAQRCVCDNYFDKSILEDHIKNETKFVEPKITECCIQECPPGYDVSLEWNDTVIPQICDCEPCENYPPKRACKLRRPKRRYDPMKFKYTCPPKEEKCPPRLDDLTGMNIIKPKCLPKLKPGKCKPCEPTNLNARCANLKRPKKLYDDTKMTVQWGDKCIVEGCPPRMDENLKISPKKLPKFKNSLCKPCDPIGLKYNPPLKRLKPKFNPNFDIPCYVEDPCDILPPRMDAVLCWRPKRKKLPKFGECKKISKIRVCCDCKFVPD